ncbi:MAG: hypothetical protein WC121_02810 [Candidatus Kapaibacterium sp.]
MRDTIYSIDTVYIQNKLDSISQLDMGQHINTIHSTYDSNMIVIYWVLGIAFAVFGILIPWLLNKNIDKTETRIQEDSNRNEIRLNREIEHIRNENRHFQESINERIEERLSNKLDEYDREIEKNTKKLKEDLRIELGNLHRYREIRYNTLAGIVFCIKMQYKESLELYLRAIYDSVLTNNTEHIKAITDNINNNIDYYKKVKKSELSPSENVTIDEYIKEIESKLTNDTSTNKAYNKFKSTLMIVLNTGNPPQGDD